MWEQFKMFKPQPRTGQDYLPFLSDGHWGQRYPGFNDPNRSNRLLFPFLQDSQQSILASFEKTE